MSDHPYSPADEKFLALSYAFTALVRSLHQAEHIDMDLLFRNLAGATKQLEKSGEIGASKMLGSFCESLHRI